MSLAELIPLVNNLSQSDKLSLFKVLATQYTRLGWGTKPNTTHCGSLRFGG